MDIPNMWATFLTWTRNNGGKTRYVHRVAAGLNSVWNVGFLCHTVQIFGSRLRCRGNKIWVSDKTQACKLNAPFETQLWSVGNRGVRFLRVWLDPSVQQIVSQYLDALRHNSTSSDGRHKMRNKTTTATHNSYGETVLTVVIKTLQGESLQVNMPFKCERVKCYVPTLNCVSSGATGSRSTSVGFTYITNFIPQLVCVVTFFTGEVQLMATAVLNVDSVAQHHLQLQQRRQLYHCTSVKEDEKVIVCAKRWRVNKLTKHLKVLHLKSCIRDFLVETKTGTTAGT